MISLFLLKDRLVAHIKAADKKFTAISHPLNSKIETALSHAEPLAAINTVDIYIVDDEQQHVDLMIEMTSIAGLSATGFTSAKLFVDHPIADTDIILLDLNMPDMDGIEVIRTLYNKGCMQPIF
ncbi:MAG: response regulator [Candidatus Reddybacter sp.]